MGEEDTVKDRRDGRLLFIDNIRAVLTIEVILHHVALTYGARHGWYYYESTQDTFVNTVFSIFLEANRAYLMAFFFFIAGYFTPQTLDRKGTSGFIRDKLLRFGIPLFLFSWFIRPSIVYIMNVSTLGSRYSFWENILLMKNVAPGPLWFLETLFVFSMGYLAWNSISKRWNSTTATAGTPPGDLSIVAFGLLIMAATFVVRIFFPGGSQVFYFRLGYLPPDIALFAAGIVAYRCKWSLILNRERGLKWLAAAALLLLLLIAGMLGDSRVAFSGPFTGGFTWQSLLCSAWETFYCLSMILGLLFLFGSRFNHQGKLAGALSANAYSVYLVHTPLIVFLSCALQGLVLQPFLKFGLVSLIGVPLCFLVSHYLVKKIPYSSKVL